MSVQGAGTNPFVPHHGIETLLKKSGLGWTFLRPSFFMQNLSTTHCADIRERDEIYRSRLAGAAPTSSTPPTSPRRLQSA